ncbi:glycosyltransferase family 39 protein [Streptomyces sp. NBC_01304]|uniref:glycosyltransferase family 39 protein n=1 Tax=Streptomyces sp. NBC_01304 TaxID=2903818 RepID=UPI002E0ECF65|nr:glycosyltransferase family 39 protein [Streptomyces sp. NBC_01304]
MISLATAPGLRRLLATVPPTLLALALGLWGITRGDSMWRDEAITVRASHRTFGELMDNLSAIDAVHGLYYLMLNTISTGQFADFGQYGEYGLYPLRVPSVVATALAAAGVAAVTARLSTPGAAVIAGCVYPVFPVVQRYTQEGRSYAAVTCCLVWATYVLVRALQSDRAVRWWVPYAVLMTLAGWLHIFALLALLAHAVTVRLTSPTARRAHTVASAVAAGAVAPLALYAFAQRYQVDWLPRPGVGEWVPFLIWVALGAAAAATVKEGRTSLTANTVALPLLVLPPAVLLTVSMVKPMYTDRYVLIVWAALAILVPQLAFACAKAVRSRPAWATLAVVVTTVATTAFLLPQSLYLRSPESRQDDVLAVARAVGSVAEHRDAVVYLPARRRDWLLATREVYGLLDDVAAKVSVENSASWWGVEYGPAEVRQRILRQPRLIVLTDPPGVAQDEEVSATEQAKRQAIIDSGLIRCDTKDLPGARVIVYARTC